MRTMHAAVTITAVALAAATVAGTANGSSAKPAPHRFSLAATTTHESLLELGTADDPTGSQFVSAHDLYRGGHKVGHDGASCQIIDIVSAEQIRLQCVASLSLPEGQITAQGLTIGTEDNSTPLVLAVTGGTGRYADAAGKVVVKHLADQHSRYTFTLTD